mgnify:CR=1 FL=1
MYQLSEEEQHIIDVVEIALDWRIPLTADVMEEYEYIIRKVKQGETVACKEFVCELRKTCLYVNSCDKCKIERCKICVFKNACKYNRREKK